MDEPLASLDFKRKQEILPFLKSPAPGTEHSGALCYPFPTGSRATGRSSGDSRADGKALASGPLSETLSRLDVPLAQDREAATVWPVTIVESRKPIIISPVSLLPAVFSACRRLLPKSARRCACRFTPAMSVSPWRRRHATSILNVLPATITGLVDDHVTASAWCACRLAIRRCWRISRVKSALLLNLQIGMAVYVQIKGTSILN
jgi:molybdate transport system ATP-binding protein